jgi:hypothetical protein
MSLRDDLTQQLRRLSQHSYLLAYSTALLKTHTPSEISASLAGSVNALCTDGLEVPVESVEVSVAEVARILPEHIGFVTDVLLVEMQALLHTHLMLAANHSLDVPAKQIESLLATLWPLAGRGESEWAYREVVLLTEIRNAVMHARGKLSLPNQRLLDAGWTATELAGEKRLTTRSFSDFLRFKRAVRTVGNEALP